MMEKSTQNKEPLFDVVEVEIAAPHSERVMDTGMTATVAKSYVEVAVMRRGCETHFFKTVPHKPAS